MIKQNKKMKNKIKIILLFLGSVVIMFGSCNGFMDAGSGGKSASSGPVGEVLVVISKAKWEGNVGDTIFAILSKPFPQLPQNEATFKPIHINKKLFRSTGATHRNIIFVNILPENKEPKLTVERNHWSNPQIILNIYASSDKEFIEFFAKNSELIMKTLLDEEINRFAKLYKRYKSGEIEQILMSQHNLKMEIPLDYEIDVSKDNFVWISNEQPKTSQAIFIYYYNYKDTSDFELHNLINVRDSITRRYVPGPVVGSYMTTEKLIIPSKEVFSLNGEYACKIRGLWKTEGYLLGGPFVSVSIVDKKRNRIITADGYVYAGKQDKKIFLWQVEAILQSLTVL